MGKMFPIKWPKQLVYFHLTWLRIFFLCDENFWDLSTLLATFKCAVRACVLSRFSPVWLFVAPWTAARQAPRPWDSPGENTGAGCPFLLQGIFLTQGSDLYLLSLLHCRCILHLLSHWESPIKTLAMYKRALQMMIIQHFSRYITMYVYRLMYQHV